MKVPPSSVGSETRSHQLLRVQPVGLTAAVAAVASCMLVAVALAGFAPGGIRAGNAGSELEVPGPIQVLVPSVPAAGASPKSSEPSASAATTAAPRTQIAAADPTIDVRVTAEGRIKPPGRSARTASRPAPTRAAEPRESGRPRNAPQEPELPLFDSPFEYQDVRQAQESIATEVRRTLQNIPLAAKPDYSGLLQFSAQVSLASLSRKTSSQQLQTDAAINALREVTNSPIRQALVQSASTAFDAALSAQNSGASQVELEQILRRTFRRNLTQGFTHVVLPVVQRAVAEVIPQVQGTPAMYIAVQTASIAVSDRTCPEVVDDLAGQLQDAPIDNPQAGPSKAPPGQIGQWPKNDTPVPTQEPSTPSLEETPSPVSTVSPSLPDAESAPSEIPLPPQIPDNSTPAETSTAQPPVAAPTELPLPVIPGPECGPVPEHATGLDLMSNCAISTGVATP